MALTIFVSALAVHRGYLVDNNDEWTFSDAGFSNPPDASVFINNITNLFFGDQPGNFFGISQIFGLTEASLASAVTGAATAVVKPTYSVRCRKNSL